MTTGGPRGSPAQTGDRDMSEYKHPHHTRGPWTVEWEYRHPADIWTTSIHAATGPRTADLVAVMPREFKTQPDRNSPTQARQRANAHLIAAAPELLEALQNLLRYADRYSDEMAKHGRGAEQLGELADSVSVSGMARAAIAKATGK